jgi:mannose-6-phosphate isomerase-like protein (cupin superfamily)
MIRFTVSFAVLALFAAPALAQSAAPDSAPLYLSKDELAGRLVPDKGGLYAQAFLSRHDNTVVMVTTRDKSGEGEMHPHFNDFIFFQEGEASFTLGGTLNGPHEISPGEIRASGITGGKIVTLHPGDYVFVPAGVAHQIQLKPGAKVKYAVFKTRE